MSSIRKEFELNYTKAERILLRNEHHGFSLEKERQHRQRLDALRGSFDSSQKQRFTLQLIPGLKSKFTTSAPDPLVKVNRDLMEFLEQLSSLNQPFLQELPVERPRGGVFVAMTRRQPIKRTHRSRRELFAAEARDGTLLVFKQTSSKPYSRWTESEKNAANSEKLKWEKLKHPNVLPFLGTALFEDIFFLVSEFAEYGDIICYLRMEKGPILRLLYEVSDAIRYLHVELQKAHCDIKPDNILVTRTRQALLCDFATVKGDGAGSSANSASQRSALYLSPECLEDNKTRTTASDMWAFGISIAQILKRSAEPWEGPLTTTLHAIRRRVYEQNERPTLPQPPLKHPEEIKAWGVATRCWEREATRRLQISEASAELRGCAVKAAQMQ